jgi:3-deoxy-D-manno-octulosonic-acid transferase
MFYIYFYNVVFIILFIPAVIILFLIGLKKPREFFSGWGERLGRWDLGSGNEKPLLWIHCASLGEVRAIEALSKKLSANRILLTANTYSARAYAKKNRVADYVFYAPLDFLPVVNACFMKARPRALLIVETEIWPGLISSANKFGAKIVIINARLSEKSLAYYNLTKPLWRAVLSRVDLIAARSEEDLKRFISLGADKRKLALAGNIKYDAEFGSFNFKKTDAGIAGNNLVWVAGSTRENEEDLLIGVWLELRELVPGLTLVLAPRHIERARIIAGALRSKKINYGLFSRLNGGVHDCLIVDTFGDLNKFYSIADMVFVGGSLVDKGGQNPIEPAYYGKPVLFGPSMRNFRADAELLEKSGGGFRVKDVYELQNVATKLLLNEEIRKASGDKAKEAVKDQRGATEKVVKIIETVIRDS